MTGVSRVQADTAGGTITGAGVVSVAVNGFVISILGDSVASHGTSPHSSPKMVESSSTVFAGGIGVCRLGDAASCGHSATGSGDVFAG